MNTTNIAQYAADAANISWRAALVSTLMQLLNNRVKTINTPTALNVFLELAAGVLPSNVILLVN